MSPDSRPVLFTSAFVLIGGLQLPLAVLVGAVAGASLFIMHANGYRLGQKCLLFVVSVSAGVFMADDVNPLLNTLLPLAMPIHLGPFLCAAVAAAGTETMLTHLARRFQTLFLPPGSKS